MRAADAAATPPGQASPTPEHLGLEPQWSAWRPAIPTSRVCALAPSLPAGPHRLRSLVEAILDGMHGSLPQWAGAVAESPGGLIGGAALLVLWLLESLLPMYHASPDRRAHARRNLVLGAMNAVVASVAMVALTVTVVEVCGRAGFGLARWVEAPLVLEWAVALVALDLAHYGAHIAFHKTPALWRVHAVHHHDDEVDVTTAARFHPLEVAAQSLAALPVVALMGLSLYHIVAYEAALVAASMFHHANLRLPLGLERPLRWLIVTPRMHWVHHSSWQPETDSNYGAVLSVWDRLFGTYRLRSDPATIRFGLEGFTRTDTRTLRGMAMTPIAGRRARPGAPPRQVELEAEESPGALPRRRRRARPAREKS